jgi:hypothetical protein
VVLGCVFNCGEFFFAKPSRTGPLTEPEKAAPLEQIIRAQPKRIREVDRIAARKSIQVQPTREPDGVFLGELSGSAVPLKQRAAKWK